MYDIVAGGSSEVTLPPLEDDVVHTIVGAVVGIQNPPVRSQAMPVGLVSASVSAVVVEWGRRLPGTTALLSWCYYCWGCARSGRRGRC